jgi:hypothetical protein
LNDRIKRELRLLEHAEPRLKDAYTSLRYCDEMWFFTTETLASGYVEYEYIGDTPPQGIDLTIEGTNYTVLKERVPETGMNLVALVKS